MILLCGGWHRCNTGTHKNTFLNLALFVAGTPARHWSTKPLSHTHTHTHTHTDPTASSLPGSTIVLATAVFHRSSPAPGNSRVTSPRLHHTPVMSVLAQFGSLTREISGHTQTLETVLKSFLLMACDFQRPEISGLTPGV